jgi:hypothetical protein
MIPHAFPLPNQELCCVVIVKDEKPIFVSAVETRPVAEEILYLLREGQIVSVDEARRYKQQMTNA